VRYAIANAPNKLMIDKNSCKLIICYNEVKLMIGVVRYDGLLDLSLSRDCRRLTHPTFYWERTPAGEVNVKIC
jgi:hypothetical protein